MAESAGRPVTSTALLLAVVLAASAATCLCAAPTSAPDDVVGAGRGTFPRSRFLATAAAFTRKMGACRAGDDPAGACGGVGHFVRCCGRACTDVRTSASNCGACGKRCAFGQRCCAGRCVEVAYDADHCGACGRACANGVPCTYGMCGYA